MYFISQHIKNLCRLCNQYPSGHICSTTCSAWAHWFVVFVVFQSFTTSEHIENDVWLHGSKSSENKGVISMGFCMVYTNMLYNNNYLEFMDGDSQFSGVKDCCFYLLEMLYLPWFLRQNTLEKLCWCTTLKGIQSSLEKVVLYQL